MTRVKVVAFTALFFIVALVGAVILGNRVAVATPDYGVSCPGVTGWRVNPDELALKPTLDTDGAQFTEENNDGKGLLKRDISPVKIAELPALSFEVTVHTGVEPLIKAETTSPYSTINFKADGTLWSSKIPSGPGSQSAPVADRATLAALAPYTADTRVVTVGFGYANDTGNEATVSSFTYGETKYSLKCVPEQTESPSPSPSASASPAPTKAPTIAPTTAPAVTPSMLPLTGEGGGTNWPLVITTVGVLIIAGGVGAVAIARRRRARFVA